MPSDWASSASIIAGATVTCSRAASGNASRSSHVRLAALSRPAFCGCPVVIEHRVNALLPLAALIDQRVTQPHPGAQIEQVLGRDVGLWQPPGHQQLAQMACVAAVGLGALLVALQRAGFG